MGLNKNSRILITGGYGFLGNAAWNEFKSKGYHNLVRFRSSEYNLTKKEDVKRLFDEKGKFDVVVHLAAIAGGVGYLRENSGEIFINNLLMDVLVLDECKIRKVEKFVGVGSSYSYPKNSNMPLKEEDIWKGDVEESTAAYSLPKRMLLSQSQLYSRHHGIKAIHLLITSIYGPGMAPSRAIVAMIERFSDAIRNKQKKVVNWGSGNATRDWLYIDDAARAVAEATEKYDKTKPINISSGVELSLKELSKKIAKIIGFDGEIEWDASKPEGPKRMVLDTSNAYLEFGFRAQVSLEEGLKKTVNWLLKEKNIKA